MFDSVLLDSAPAVLDRARAARDAELTAAADLLLAAAEWGALHPCPVDEAPAGWGTPDLHGEGVVPLAGDGAPLVAEFAPLTLAAHLGMGPDAGRTLLGDALELRHRLPRLWDRVVLHHEVPAWRARIIAQRTTRLTARQASSVDRSLSDTRPDRLTTYLVTRVVDEVVLFDDPDRAGAEQQRAEQHRHVRLDHSPVHGAPGTTDVHMVLDTLDALNLDDTLSEIAAVLGDLGDDGEWEVRRARAVGVLADPQRALDLVAKTRLDPRPVAGGSISLFAHLGVSTGSTALAGATVEGLGALTLSGLEEWVATMARGGARITVRPVIDLTDAETLTRAVDAHDPPAWMRDAAVLRDDTCCFPGCPRDSRRADLDHIEPYVPLDAGGATGQTHLDNLAPLCRAHHRLKTHGGWRYQRLAEQHFAWTGPDGRMILTTTQRRRR